jgi:hypothetical protein
MIRDRIGGVEGRRLGFVLHRSVFLALALWHVRWRRPRWLGGYLAAQWECGVGVEDGQDAGQRGVGCGREERMLATACGVEGPQGSMPGRVVRLLPGLVHEETTL